MLDPNIVRTKANEIKQLIANGRGNAERANVDKWLELDTKRSQLHSELEELNRQKNELAKKGKDASNEEARAAGTKLREQVKATEVELAKIEAAWQEIMSWIPNLPEHPEDMPIGAGEHDNRILKAWIPGQGYLELSENTKPADTPGQMPKRPMHGDNDSFKPLHHIELGEHLGIIDNKQSAAVSGSRFTYLLGDAVLLQYAIQQLVFGELLKRRFLPIVPPMLARERALFGSSHLPEQQDQIYQIKNDNVEDAAQLYLLGSSEPINFAYFADKVMDMSELPLRVFAYTTCFRSEAGSWGRDTKGIKRVHQFDKIEINCVCLPEQSAKIFEEFLSINEWLLQQLQLPYQLVLKCTGDAGYLASAKQIDPEVWLGGTQEFMEVGTDTNTTSYQARRLNIRFENEQGKKEYAHTVNDTGVAMGRMLIAILDNYQQADGSIVVPEVLRQFVGKDKITPRS